MTIKFGTDGIRGPVESKITPEVCLRIGHAAGVVLKDMGWETVLIGKDTRVSGYMLESALQAGFIAAGVNVRLLGPLPTPGVAYLTRSLRNQFGLVISASHNNYLDNGIKLFAGTGEKISKDAEKKIYTLFNQLGIWHKRKNTPRELSGGMKRRLMIARALIHSPKILILDEPTAGVDTELRLTMWDFFQEINNQGVTIILTTHYLEEAERLCKNLAIIHKGNIIQNSSMDEVFNMKKKHTYIIKTLEEIQSNIKSEGLSFKKIDSNTCEIIVDDSVSITHIIEKMKDNNLNVINIISKRNRLEELFMDLTKEEISV